MVRLQYLGKEPIGYVPPRLDRNGEEWLIPPRLAQPDNGEIVKVFQPGETFELDEIRHRHAVAFLRTCREFKLLEATYQYGR